ncbi:MAG: SDR family NAD(P)-dependent oxidoreductase, partial [Blastocatellia bacterium]|nr:SDR family NAD(P)-dependent oxidoreductase [Blastocatellia bacterium]
MSAYQQRKKIEEFIANHRPKSKAPETVPSTRIEISKNGSSEAALNNAEKSQTPEPIAIIGLSGYFPSCMTHQDFWRAIDNDEPLIEKIPENRSTLSSLTNKTTTDSKYWGGFIPDIKSFDAEFFGILPGEAELMDPQLRLLLMSVYHTLEDAGYAPRSFKKSATGVFIGFEWNEYLQLLKASNSLLVSGFSSAESIIANQISYYFDLRGPSEVVNAMCAGAAVAIHRAVKSIRTGEIAQAVVGAVNIMLNPDTFTSLSQMGQLSTEPTVHSFGKKASGYLRGEGIASLLLKPLSQAIKDGDSIYALIKNSAVNFNGQVGSSISSPNIERHIDVVKKCSREAKVDVRQIAYIEAQGMGSQITDLAEWETFNRALKDLAKEQDVVLATGSCKVSTLKPMTGHMHSASSLGALLKIVRSLQTEKIHKIIGFEEINPHLDTQGEPCSLATETVPLPKTGSPRLAALHSYGATGTTAHLLIEEYRQEIPSSHKSVYIIPFSARTPEQLRKLVTIFRSELAANPSLPLASVSKTMQFGRDSMECRVAFVVDSIDSFVDSATSWLNNEVAVSVFYARNIEWSSNNNLRKLINGVASRWASGLQVDWQTLNNSHNAVRLHLPTYPFEAVAHWHEKISAVTPSAEVVPTNETISEVADQEIATVQQVSETAVQDQTAVLEAESIIRTLVASFLKVEPSLLNIDKQFSELGFNSLLVTQISAQLDKEYAIKLPAAKIFTQTSPRGLATLIAEKLAISSSQKVDTKSENSVKSIKRVKNDSRPQKAEIVDRRNDEPIAIVGVSGVYPEAKNINQFWQNLSQAIHCVKPLPSNRWPSEAYYEKNQELAIKRGKYYAQWGGFLDEVDRFDSLFFNISPAEAEYMHVKERLFMQCAWHVLEDAGYTPSSLKNETVGVFVGVSKAGLDSYKDSYFSLANRISYKFNFNGPSMPVDTACSSSLSALHEACLHIRSGDCTVAIVGGVNAYTHPSTFAEFSRLRVMSPDGKTRAFGDQGNGFVPGEGVGAFFIKPLNRAVEDGDNIYAVIRSTSINHGGKTNGYTVPNPTAHTQLIRKAINRAGINARSISYVEAHGTGTPLGDPIEIQGLTDAFRQDTEETGYCRIGSVKTNIGHLEAGAGIAGLTKIVLQMKHKRLVPSLHSETLNQHIDFSLTPFQVQHQSEDWAPVGDDGQPISRIACISSFGAGGSNAHAVIEEFIDDPSIPASNEPVVIILSAKSESALRTYAAQLAEAVASEKVLDLQDLAFTLQVGREAMTYRLAFTAQNLNDVVNKLNAASQGKHPEVYIGQVGNSSLPFIDEPDLIALINDWLAEGKLSNVAKAWVNGFDLDWSLAYSKQRRRVSLPGYPFEKETFRTPFVNYSVDIKPEALTATAMVDQQLHPLLHQNVSDISRQAFRSTFKGTEFFFTDHVVHGRKIMPGAAFLEIARAAIENSLPAKRNGSVCLKNIVWAEPIVAQQQMEIMVEVLPVNTDTLTFEIYSENNSRIVHARGTAELTTPTELYRTDLELLKKRFTLAKISSDFCYKAFERIGISYGAAHRGLFQLLIGNDQQNQRQVLAEIVIPEDVAKVEKFVLHPSILDSAFQAVFGFAYDLPNAQAAIPFALDSIQIYKPLPRKAWALMQQVGAANRYDGMHKLNITLYNDNGEVCVTVNGLTSRVPKDNERVAVDRRETLLFVPQQQPISLEVNQPSNDWSSRTVVFCGIEPVFVEGANCQYVELFGHSIDRAYEIATTSIFQTIQEQVRLATNQKKVLVQVVVANSFGFIGGISGLLKTAHLENPAFFGQLIKVNDASKDLAYQIERLSRNSSYQIVTCTRESTTNTVWEPFPWQGTVSMPWKKGGVYLITGGAGGLGKIFAQEIACQIEDAYLILTGRRAKDPQINSFLQQLRSKGAYAEYYQADISKVEDIRQVVQTVYEQFGRLNGILHCAGVLSDNYIAKKNVSKIVNVLQPKVKGTINLDLATQELSLDLFVMFSSAAAVVGHPGQSDYSTANGFMDEYAAYRNSLVTKGLRQGVTVSINWALWQD